MTTSLDPQIKRVADRILKNAQWASLYFGYFEASNKFLRENSRHLDDDALEMLNVLDRGLPRLSALCLCRFWDLPGKKRQERHSLPALIGISAFSRLAASNDPLFVKDCRRLQRGPLISELREFRSIDLAHNRPIDRNAEGLTVDRLRRILRATQAIVDRLTNILKVREVRQQEIFQSKKNNCEQFWDLVRTRVVRIEAD